MSGMGSFWSRRVSLGPVVATLWSVMVPHALRSVLSSRKLALAGLGMVHLCQSWALSAQF